VLSAVGCVKASFLFAVGDDAAVLGTVLEVYLVVDDTFFIAIFFVTVV